MKAMKKCLNQCARLVGVAPMLLICAMVLPDLSMIKGLTFTEANAASERTEKPAIELTEEKVEYLVRLAYPYVAMYNVNNKFARKQGGWNTIEADTQLKDHTVKEIARPNNDSLYISALLDLTQTPMIIEMPAFDSKYVSLMITGYDHYVNIPMSTGKGDFDEPETMLVYTERTEGYEGEMVEGIDRYFEASGDFLSAVFRVMPHANEPERFDRIVEKMNQVGIMSLSEYRGGDEKPKTDVDFPDIGQEDADIFGSNFLEVMQFVFNHTTFDPQDELDRKVLDAFEPLGIMPGQEYDPSAVAEIDGQRFREAAERVFESEMAKMTDANFMKSNLLTLFKPKGEISQEALLFQSVIGPIGQPAQEAVYPAIVTDDGQPMNAKHDYVIRMGPDELPPARAFWSFTLYDSKNGWFMPNDRKKYSVGENGGMKMDEEGGIDIYLAAEKPEGVPEENWLPLVRGDYAIDVVLRLYNPDLEAFENWTPPKAERLPAE